MVRVRDRNANGPFFEQEKARTGANFIQLIDRVHQALHRPAKKLKEREAESKTMS